MEGASEGLGRGLHDPCRSNARDFAGKSVDRDAPVSRGVSAETAIFKTNKILTPPTAMIDGYRVVIAQKAKSEIMPWAGLACSLPLRPSTATMPDRSAYRRSNAWDFTGCWRTGTRWYAARYARDPPFLKAYRFPAFRRNKQRRDAATPEQNTHMERARLP